MKKFTPWKARAVIVRLKEASLAWKQGGGVFEKRSRSWRPDFVMLFIGAMAILAGWGRPEHAQGILTGVLSFTVLTVVRWVEEARGSILFDEAVHLLPARDDQLESEVRRRIWFQLGGGLLITMIYGAFLSDSWWPGMLKVALVYGCLLATAMVFLSARLNWLYVIGWSTLVVSFVGYWFLRDYRDAIISGFSSLPWYRGLSPTPESWLHIFGLALAGLGSLLWVWRRVWWVEQFDRTSFYENFGATDYSVEWEEVDESMREAGMDEGAIGEFTRRAEPNGRVEQWIWHLFTEKDRAVVRLSEFCQQSFVRSLFWWAVGLAAVLLMARFGPAGYVEKYSLWIQIGLAVWAWGISSNRGFLPSEMMLDRVSAGFLGLILPVGMARQERLLLKEGLVKWPILAVFIGAGLVLLGRVHFSVGWVFVVLSLIGLTSINLLNFWFILGENWRGRGPFSALFLLVFLGALGFQILFFVLLLTEEEVTQASEWMGVWLPMLISLLGSVVTLGLARIFLMAHLRSRRTDLVRLVDND